MLVLTRKEGESVRLGDSIELVIVRIDGKKIRLGIESDRRLPILRGELIQSDLPLPQLPSESGDFLVGTTENSKGTDRRTPVRQIKRQGA